MQILQTGSESSFLLVVFWVALSVILFMLVILVRILRSDKQRRAELESKPAPEPVIADAENALPEVKPQSVVPPAWPVEVLPPDRVEDLKEPAVEPPAWPSALEVPFASPASRPPRPTPVQVVPAEKTKTAMTPIRRVFWEETDAAFRNPVWFVCFLMILYAAWFHFLRELSLVAGTSLYMYFLALAVLSPACFAIAVLRIMGQTWRRALLLFLWPPLFFALGAVLYPVLEFLLYYVSGKCC